MVDLPIAMVSPWEYRAGELYVELVPLPDACWVVRHWEGVEASSLVQQRALLSAIEQCLNRNRTTLMVDSHRSFGVLQWLLKYHFKPVRCKYIYEKKLPLVAGAFVSSYESVSWAPLQPKSLAELGEPVFFAYLVDAATDDPDASAAVSPEQEFQELLLHAGDAFNAEQWFVAFDGSMAVGIILPQQFADKPSEGTLSYIGVMPSFRQQGYGERLHQLGLSLLFSWGVQRYIGSTGQTNIAMQRVFEKNQCTLLGKRYFLTPLTP